MGPFSRVKDELGTIYVRGIPEPIDNRSETLLRTSLYDDLFVLSDTSIGFTSSDERWRAVIPEKDPCMWEGHFALLTGPFLEIEDDDHHRFQLGIPQEVCSKTLKVLQTDGYRSFFGVLNRASEVVDHQAVSCEPSGSCC